jgi:hypothetical protein
MPTALRLLLRQHQNLDLRSVTSAGREWPGRKEGWGGPVSIMRKPSALQYLRQLSQAILDFQGKWSAEVQGTLEANEAWKQIVELAAQIKEDMGSFKKIK